ncbi:hypothetical protein Tco_0922749 [Tanacetum coccineum]|uniref:Reverse transcriptase domain-containing protein n=1 Tax=Tanacetum coccineum TaxID=301880 RepID=A0ABQ5CZ05_9ASTR
MQALEIDRRDTLNLKRKPMGIRKSGTNCINAELPEELSRVHNTFHVSNLKKCHADEPLAVPLDGLHLDDKLHFVEEPVEIVDREVKRLKRSRIPLVKVRWNFKRGPEFTWEREDQFKKKYPHPFQPIPLSATHTPNSPSARTPLPRPAPPDTKSPNPPPGGGKTSSPKPHPQPHRRQVLHCEP